MQEPRPIDHVELDRIREPNQPSRLSIDETSLAELAQSMATLGLLEPIGIRPRTEPDTYEVVYGHRRYKAAKFLGWYTIPAVILSDGVNDLDARQAENNQRVQLTPIEEALELHTYAEQGHSAPMIAARVSRSPAWVSQRLKLLDYPTNIRDAIHQHALPLTVAALLAQIDHDSYRAYMIEEALRNGATAATAGVWLQHYLANRPRVIANTETVEEIASRRGDYKIMSPCEYCGDATELERTRVWRLCATCSEQLAGAKYGHTDGATSHVHP